jgi:hypothetical protein
MWARYILNRFNHIRELLSLEHNDLTWASHFIYLLMYMLKNFVSDLQKIFILQNLTLGFTESVSCLVWNGTAVFSVLSMKLFAQNHECESVITLFIYCWRIRPFAAVTKNFISTANKAVFVSLKFRANLHFLKRLVQLTHVICFIKNSYLKCLMKNNFMIF